MSFGRFVAREEGMTFVAHLLGDVVKDQAELMANLLGRELPWLRWLPDSEQRECVDELLGELAAGAETGVLEPFARGWRRGALRQRCGATPSWLVGCRDHSTETVRRSPGPHASGDDKARRSNSSTAAVDGQGRGPRSRQRMGRAGRGISGGGRPRWVAMTSEPRKTDSRQHQLKGSLATVSVGGSTLQQWQFEATAGARILVRHRRQRTCPLGDGSPYRASEADRDSAPQETLTTRGVRSARNSQSAPRGRDSRPRKA